jgi:hypothetical protein
LETAHADFEENCGRLSGLSDAELQWRGLAREALARDISEPFRPSP